MDTPIYSKIEHKILACFIGDQPLTNRQIAEQVDRSTKTLKNNVSRMTSKGLIESDGKSPAHYTRTRKGFDKLIAYDRHLRIKEPELNKVKPAMLNIFAQPTLKLPVFYARNDGLKAIKSYGIDAN